MKIALAGYIPVLHRGYIDFFSKYSSDANTELLIFGCDLWREVDYLRKDLRQLDPSVARDLIIGAGIFKDVRVVEATDLKSLSHKYQKIVLPNEDVSRAVAKKFLSGINVEYAPIFLRWDRRGADGVDKVDDTIDITTEDFAKQKIAAALKIAESSSDIWRRVGAVLVDFSGREIGEASNTGEPTEHSPWIEGDPRNIFNRGADIEKSVFIHAESRLIAEAARDGTKLDGGEIYVSTFPCPACAKLIAHSGIKKCFFYEGYATLDGKRIMEAYDVKLMRVTGVDQVDSDARVWREYPKK